VHSSIIKNKLLHEIERLPDDKLSEVYHYVHDIRLGSEKNEQKQSADIMSFSGSWQDIDDNLFDHFLSEVTDRRSQAFKRRRNNAAVID